jgi:hypothetical protein
MNGKGLPWEHPQGKHHHRQKQKQGKKVKE